MNHKFNFVLFSLLMALALMAGTISAKAASAKAQQSPDDGGLGISYRGVAQGHRMISGAISVSDNDFADVRRTVKVHGHKSLKSTLVMDESGTTNRRYGGSIE
jgi:hypothetical protein